MSDRNPELLSDGFLFESRDAWEEAFRSDPSGALKRIADARLALAQKLGQIDSKQLVVGIDRLIENCRASLKNLLLALPKEGSLFPKAPERNLVITPICRFLSELEPLRSDCWSLTTSASEQKAALLALQKDWIAFDASLLSAHACSLDPTIEKELAEEELFAKALKAGRQSQLTAVEAQEERLNRLFKTFFCDFVTELSKKSDLEKGGKEAAPAALIRICGEAEGFLASLA